jgi:two-component system sensor histidine kinase AtoS
MGGVLAVVEERQRAAIVDQVLRRGEVIARDLAAISSGPLLLYNFTALEQNVARAATADDVEYAIVLDAEGRVAAHSEDAGLVGRALEGPVARDAVATQELAVRETVEGARREAVYDFAVPVVVSGQRWGTVRVGLSRRHMEAQIAGTRWNLAALSGITLLLGGLGAALVARRIARPVRQLATGAEAISRGELGHRIEPSGFDEVAQLAVAFNHMAAQLSQQRSDLETAHAELRRRFEELTDLKRYTDSVLGSLTSGVVTLDLDGRVATMNPAAEMLTGLVGGETIGRYATEVFVHSPDVGEILLETLASHSGVTNLSLTLRRPNGGTLPVEMSAAPLRGAEGKELGVVGVFGDVTALRELEAQLRRSDRLAALGTLAAGLAHEIKNPLMSLRTFTRAILDRREDARFRESFREVVPRELERINALVEQLLELARPSPLRLQAVLVPALLDRVLDLYAYQLETGGIAVLREYGRDLPAITADPDLLHRAVVNLVANALEAMQPGGRLVVRAGWHLGPDPLGPAQRGRPPRRIRIEVEDSGAGIAPRDADKVFDPFFTTKAAGTGLGLALTHKIVEDHGGSISFRSAPGRGTVFRILLPLVAERSGGPSDA